MSRGGARCPPRAARRPCVRSALKTTRGTFFGSLVFAAVQLFSSARAADEPVVALPPFIVEEASKGPPWRYAEIPGYEILSRCSDATTREVVEVHWRLHQLLAEILPERLQVKLTVPRALI